MKIGIPPSDQETSKGPAHGEREEEKGRWRLSGSWQLQRMGTSKMSLELAEGVRLGGVALQQALSSELNSVVVVVREGESLDWLTASVPAHRLPDRCRIAVCPDAASGMAHSLRTGIQAARRWAQRGSWFCWRISHSSMGLCYVSL